LERVVALAGAARVRLLPGVHLGVREESVLEVVDSGLDRFGIRDGAEMPGYLEAALVRLADGGAQFLARAVLVGLEGRGAPLRPVCDRLPGILGTGQLADLEVGNPGSVEVGTGDVEMRSGNGAALDGALQLQLGLRLDAPGRPHGRHAVGE